MMLHAQCDITIMKILISNKLKVRFLVILYPQYIKYVPCLRGLDPRGLQYNISYAGISRVGRCLYLVHTSSSTGPGRTSHHHSICSSHAAGYSKGTTINSRQFS